MSKKRNQSFIQLGLVVGIAILLNILGSAFYTYFDLTEDKRFTLTDPTKQLLESLDETVYVEVLLEGEFPAGFKRLQRSVSELLTDFRTISGGQLEYVFTDPNQGTIDKVNMRREALAREGIMPTNLRLQDKEGTSEKLIYPYARITFKGRQAIVDLLDEEAGGANPEEQLNYSISQLEFNFANALQKLKTGKKEIVAFTVGHGELDEFERKELVRGLRAYYEVGTFDLDSATFIPKGVQVLIVAKPSAPFNDRDKFLIDQYVMNGGKVIWLIDRLKVGLDSMRGTNDYIPIDNDMDLDAMFFNYGVRINPDMVLDLQSSRIPMVIDPTGKQDLFKWFYHPIIVPTSDHPVVKNLDGINLFFPSSIDTIRTKTDVRKTILLTSSEYSRIQPNITRLNFEILRYDPDPSKFNKPYQPVAVLLEGRFPSFFENKVSEGMHIMLEEIDQQFTPVSQPTRMLFVSDGDIARNLYNPATGQSLPLGYNRFERYRFANKDFLLNAVEYLRDESGIIEARGKEVKLRLLDTTKADEEETLWQLFNIGIPLVFLMLFGLVYNWWRRRKYAGSE